MRKVRLRSFFVRRECVQCSKPNHFSLFYHNVILRSLLGTLCMVNEGIRESARSVVILISIHLMNAIVTSIATSLASIEIELH